METVLKTVLVFMASVGSNPTPSATMISDGFLIGPIVPQPRAAIIPLQRMV